MTLDIDEISQPTKPDYRRANGAPMIYVNGKNERFSRPSGWGKELDDENALVNWKLNRAIEGVASSRAIQAKVQAAKEDDREAWKNLREEAINTGRGDEASDIGTALHAMTDRWEDPDDDFHPGDPYEPHLEAYGAELARLGLVSRHFEVKMANVKYRTAGTADRIYELTRALITPDGEIMPAGTLVIGDTKTGKKLDFSAPGYCVQLHIYAASTFYDVTTEEFAETPAINQQWGMLVHLPSDRVECNIYWVDLGVGEFGAYLVHEVRRWRRDWKSGEHSMPLVPDPHDLTVIAGLGGELISIEEADDEMAAWLESVRPWATERIKAIGENTRARTHLTTFWPEGLPTPKQGITTIDDMQRLISHLDEVEKRFEMPFIPNPIKTTGHSRTVARQVQAPNKEKES